MHVRLDSDNMLTLINSATGGGPGRSKGQIRRKATSGSPETHLGHTQITDPVVSRMWLPGVAQLLPPPPGTLTQHHAIQTALQAPGQPAVAS